jgi:molybdopterin converting factor subunit 1
MYSPTAGASTVTPFSLLAPTCGLARQALWGRVNIQPVKVKVLYFAALRERLGRAEEECELPLGTTAQGLLSFLAQRDAGVAALRPVLKVAVNREFSPLDRALAEGDEVALLPPVSGGAGPHCRLSDGPLCLEELVAAVRSPRHGGLVTFVGQVRGESRGRQVIRLDYEAYPPMAEKAMRVIAEEIARDFPGTRVAIVHRVGRLGIGEDAVMIAASAPHRAEAFDACRRAIERLKESVPIWKKETTVDGEEWVGLGP